MIIITPNLYSIEVTAALTCAHIQKYSAEVAQRIVASFLVKGLINTGVLS